ncbi:MAG TPA: TonB-dependent receptor [Allosphingosinicella sp.]|jgi:TonB-dependent receptor|nr:TonB-dependent receptor [Allosphingosinicella sp.]
MRLKSVVLCSTSFAALALVASPAAAQPVDQTEPGEQQAQETPADSTDLTAETETASDESIVVTGLRRSLQSAQNIKRNSDQIIDGIVAEDIGKLPDIAVSETAARIPGVQVTRRGGEADTVLVRGLPDFSTTYNGREIFTAERREVALQDFPSANIAALEVFKTTTADLVEAGLAGQVNVRSRRPFDFDGFQFAGSVWALHTQQAGEWNPNANLLVTNRWEVGGGEFGILANASYTEMDYLDSEISNTDFIAGGPAGSRFPDIQRLFYRSGNRVRPSANIALQYRPAPGIEIYAEGLYQGFRNKVSDRLWTQPLWGGASYTNLVFRDGTDLLSSGTVTSPFRADGFQGGTYNKTDTFQGAIGGRYETGPLNLTADIARTHSRFRGSTASVDYRVVPGYTVNWDNETPEFELVNFDATNPANYIFNGFYEEAQVSRGDDWQFRLDADYELDNSVFNMLEAGVRYTTRDAHREFGNRFAGFDERYAGGPIPISSVPLDYRLFHSGFRGTDVQSGFTTWLAPTYGSIRDNLEEMRQFVISRGPPDPRSFGVFTTDPPAPNPASVYDATENTLAGYVQARLQFGEVVDGVIGLRAVRTQTQLNGTALVANVPTPIDSDTEYTDWLPNISARVHISPRLQLRLSATQTRTRPTFEQLNPSVNVGSPSGTCTPGGDPFACARIGSGGNPNLRPFTSNNYDASLEYYFSRVGFISGAVFWRDLEGFIQNQEIRTIDPVLGPLIISGPVNTSEGSITGAEVQLSTFFDFEWVPELLRGFGVQANATWLDHEVDDRRIFGVSNFAYNLVGMYERGPITARLSWNDFGGRLETIQNRGNDLYIERSDPAGRLDLSLSFNVNDNFTVFGDWTNILGDPFRQDLSSARDGAPRSEYVRYLRYEETTVSAGIRFRF